MIQYVIAGLALGSIYAIAAASLVTTYVSAGVLNFSFAAMAYFVARFYYYLNSQHGWTGYSAGVVAILGLGPLLGVVLYFGLFQFLRDKSTLIKLVATIGLLVALPGLADLIFGTQSISAAPGLTSPADRPYHLFGASIQTGQVVIYGFLLFIVVVGTVVLRLTDIGLKVRGVVDSEAMASLSGTRPASVALGVWIVSTTLAGLTGVLVAPTQGLTVGSPTSGGMTALMTGALAAVVVARLRSLVWAVVVALVMGVVTDVIQKYLPANSSLTSAIVVSVPFGFILVALIIYLVRGTLDDHGAAIGPLDRAIRPANQGSEDLSAGSAGLTRFGYALGLLPLLGVALLPLIFKGSPYWLGLVTAGICYAITFLTFTAVTGEGGMLWLSQIVFAGAGALATGQFATVYHVPVLLAVLLGGLVAAVFGALIGLLTIRLGDLYVAIVTLTFGSLVEGLVFTRDRFVHGGLGVTVDRPGFAQTDFAFSYLGLAVFAVIALLIVNLRRSTSGMALRAVRDSETASRMLGLSVIQVKVIIGAIGAFIAAVGGGFLAMYAENAQPTSFDIFLGMIWLAVAVTWGIRSITGAALAGITLSIMPGIFATYVPVKWAVVPSVLFGLGAVSVARNPEGVIAQYARQLSDLIPGVRKKDPLPSAAPPTMTGTAAPALSEARLPR